MPDDFDPDAFMAQKKKTGKLAAAPPPASGDFDPDSFMSQRGKAPAKPAPAPATASTDFGFEKFGAPAAQSMIREARESTPDPQFQGRLQAAERQRAQYEAKPLVGKIAADTGMALADYGQRAQRAGQKAMNYAGYLSAGVPLPEDTGAAPTAAGRAAQQATEQRMGERRLATYSPESDLRRQIIGGAVETPGIVAAGAAGGIPAIAAYNLAQQDWNKPVEAVANAALSTAIPIGAGRLAGRLAQPALGKLTQPIAQKAGQLVTEATGGALGNVGLTAAENVYQGRPIDQNLVEQGIIGAATAPAGMFGGEGAPRRPRPVEQVRPPEMSRPVPIRQTEVVNLADMQAGRRRAVPVTMDDATFATEIGRMSTPEGDPRDRARSIRNLQNQPQFQVEAREMKALAAEDPTILDALPPDLKRALMTTPAPIRGLSGPNIQGGNIATPETDPHLSRGMYGIPQKSPKRGNRLSGVGGPYLGHPTNIQGGAGITPETDPQLSQGMYGAKPKPIQSGGRLSGVGAPNIPEQMRSTGGVDQRQRATTDSAIPQEQRAKAQDIVIDRTATAPPEMPVETPLSQPMGAEDPRYQEAKEMSEQRGKVSTVLIQRTLKLGFQRAEAIKNAILAERTQNTKQPPETPTPERIDYPIGKTPPEAPPPESGPETPTPQPEYDIQQNRAKVETQPTKEVTPELEPESASMAEGPEIRETAPVSRNYGPPERLKPAAERRPVPIASDENIAELRDRRAQLARTEATRRGELPDDLSDEMRELGASIAEYENKPLRGQPPMEAETFPRPDDRARRLPEMKPDELDSYIKELEQKRNESIRGVQEMNPDEEMANREALKQANAERRARVARKEMQAKTPTPKSPIRRLGKVEASEQMKRPIAEQEANLEARRQPAEINAADQTGEDVTQLPDDVLQKRLKDIEVVNERTKDDPEYQGSKLQQKRQRFEQRVRREIERREIEAPPAEQPTEQPTEQPAEEPAKPAETSQPPKEPYATHQEYGPVTLAENQSGDLQPKSSIESKSPQPEAKPRLEPIPEPAWDAFLSRRGVSKEEAAQVPGLRKQFERAQKTKGQSATQAARMKAEPQTEISSSDRLLTDHTTGTKAHVSQLSADELARSIEAMETGNGPVDKFHRAFPDISGRYLYLGEVSTPPESRGKGGGSRVLDAAKRLADKTGQDLVADIEPLDEQMSAQELRDYYKRRGFDVEGDFLRYKARKGEPPTAKDAFKSVFEAKEKPSSLFSLSKKPSERDLSGITPESTKAWIRQLSAPEKKSFQEYTGGYADAINSRLRNGEPLADLSKSVERIDEAIGKFATPDEMTVYRGAGRKEWATGLENGEIKAGSVIRDKAYSSTSLSEKVASQAEFGPVVLKIKLPKGTNAAPLMDKKVSVFGNDQQELLLPRDSGFKVTKITKDEGRTIVDVDFAPPAATTRKRADVENSPQFNRFFKQSEAVDEQGKPKVLYHGASRDFDTFEGYKSGQLEGHYFTPYPEVAEEFATWRNPGKYGSPEKMAGARTMPVYLSIQKAARKADLTAVVERLGKQATPQEITAALKEQGFDGYIGPTFIGNSKTASGLGDEYVVFDPRQIKSATGNSGEFNPETSGIMTSLSKKGSNYWETEGIPRTPNGTYADLTPEQVQDQILQSRTEFRAHATRGRLYTNEQGAISLAQALKKAHGGSNLDKLADVMTEGIAVGLNEAGRTLKYLEQQGRGATDVQRKDLYNNLSGQLKKAIVHALETGAPGIEIVSTDAMTLDPETGTLKKSAMAVRQVATHERVHISQFDFMDKPGGIGKVGLFDDRTIISDPDYAQHRAALLKAGYGEEYLTPSQANAEAMAHVLAGQYREIGYKNPDDAAGYLARTFDKIYDIYGEESLNSLRLRTRQGQEARANVRSRRLDQRGEGTGRTTQEEGREGRGQHGPNLSGDEAGISERAQKGREAGSLASRQAGVPQNSAPQTVRPTPQTTPRSTLAAQIKAQRAAQPSSRTPQTAKEYFDSLSNPAQRNQQSPLTRRGMEIAREALKKTAAKVESGKWDDTRKNAVIDAADQLMTAARLGDKKAIREAKDALESARASKNPIAKVAKSVQNALKTSRTLVFGSDISYPLRQALPLTAPPQNWGSTAKAGKSLWKALLSERGAEEVSRMFDSHPYMQKADKAGLELTHFGEAEEVFGSKTAEKIPGWGRLIKRTEAANNAYLDHIRLESFAKMAKSIEGNAKLDAAGKERGFKAAAEAINTLTGKTDLGEGKVRDVVRGLQGAMTAPRLNLSRMQLLNPAKYAKLYKENPMVARQTALMVGETLGGIALLGYAAAMTGKASFSLDTDDPDFGKIVVGKTRYDLSGGLLPILKTGLSYAKFGAALGRSAIDDSDAATADLREDREKAWNKTKTFVRGRLAPFASLGVDVATGKDLAGKPVTAKEFKSLSADNPLLRPMKPAIASDFLDGYRNEGWAGVAKTVPAIAGAGTSTYAEEDRAGYLDRKGDFLKEARKRGVTFGKLTRERVKGGDRSQTEPDDLYLRRTKQADEYLNDYGSKLLKHPEFDGLNGDQQQAAIRKLKTVAVKQAGETEPDLDGLDAETIIDSVKESAEEKPQRREGRRFQPSAP